MNPSLILSLTLLGQFVWAQERMRELPDEQLRVQSTLGLLYDALISQDRDVVYALIHVDHDPDDLVRAAQSRRSLANVRFERSIARLKLAHGDNPFDDHHIFLGDDFAFALLTGEWDIRGDAATIPPDRRMGGPDQPPAPPLIRVKGIWKINLTPPSPPASAEAFAKQIDQYTDVLDRTAADINTGKLKTVDQIRAALAAAPKLTSAGYMPDLVLGAAK